MPAKILKSRPFGPVGKMRALVSAIQSRIDLATTAGKTYGGKRNLYHTLGYELNLLPRHFRDRYARNGIAARVVRAPARATWRGGAELIEDEDPKVSTAFEKAWADLDKRLKVWSVFQRADQLARLLRYSVILIGAPGDLDTALPKTFSVDDLAYLAPYGEDDAVVHKYDEDPASARFGLPTEYTVTRTASLAVKRTVTRPVHWSRIIHVVDDALDDLVFGQPCLQPIWNYLDDLEKVVGGGSEAFWQRVNQGLVFKLDPELDFDKEDEKAFEEQTDEYVHNLRRVITARGMDVTPLGSDVSNFNNQVDALITLIAGATNIPKRILVGSERGELSSAQDRTEWDQFITDRRNEFGGPRVVRPTVDLLVEHGALPTPKDDYEVRWPEQTKLDDKERAQVADGWAQLNAKSGGTVVLPEEIRERCLGLKALTPEQLKKVEEDKAAAAEAAQPPPGQDPNAPSDPNAPPGEDGSNGPVDVEAHEKRPPGYEEPVPVVKHDRSKPRAAGGPGSGWTAEGGHVPGSQGGGEPLKVMSSQVVRANAAEDAVPKALPGQNPGGGKYSASQTAVARSSLR